MGKEKLSRISPKIEYDTIIRTAMDGFLLLDMDGYFVDVNDSYCKLIGYSRDELLNMGIRDVEAKEALEDVAKHIEKVKKTGSYRFETKHRRKDGQILDIEVSATYVPKLRGQIVSFLRDITERKEDKAALERNEERLNWAQRISHVGNWDWNIVTNGLAWSDEIYRIFGLTPSKVLPARQR